MRASRTNSSPCQHLCIFCVNRLRGHPVPVRHSLNDTQRSIQSFARSLSPLDVAAANKVVEQNSSFPQKPLSNTFGGGGWARSTLNAELTPEEERLRIQIKKTAAPSKTTTRQDHTNPRPLFPTQTPQARSDPLFRATEPDRKAQRWLPNSERKSQKYPFVNVYNTRRVDLSGTQTSSPADSGQHISDVSQDWRHLRKRGQKGHQAVTASSVLQQQPIPRAAQEDTGQFEKGRWGREEQAKVGSFVGFKRAGRVSSVADFVETGKNQASVPTPSPDHGLRSKIWKPLFGNQEESSQSTSTSGGDEVLNPMTSQGRSVEFAQAPDYPATRLFTPPYRRTPNTQPLAQSTFDEAEATPATQLRPRVTHSGDAYRGKERHRQRRQKHFESEYDYDVPDAALRAERRKKRKKDKTAQKAAAPTVPIMLPGFISVTNLAKALRVKPEQFTYKLKSLGFDDMSYDHVLNAETAGLIAMEYNFEPIVDESGTEDLHPRPPPDDKSLLPQRPPIVTIMGHVDHGKTTLLDWLRNSSIAASEHGGITQHIGAFSVPMPSGKVITFLDTPGHAAFLSMRKRGANVTDIVILVVAADDSVKPQTIEAIKHAKAAKVPMIVAINKIDKGDADIVKVKQDLARHDVDVEDFGGDTQVVCVSGKTGQGMEQLEEAVVTLSEILDMRAETDGQAEGWVLEATTKKAGRVATVLVRRGTLHQGDVMVAGSTWARVRTIKNEAGIEVASAGPGTPVEVDGWKEQPSAGDEVLQAPDEHTAKSVNAFRLERAEQLKMATDMEAINDARRLEQEKREREEQIAAGTQVEPVEQKTGIKELFLIIKADVSGSVEAVVNSVSALGNEEVQPHILRSGVGPVSKFDIEHAAVAKGQIVSFNMPVDPNISRLAEASDVPLVDQNIIYRLVDDVKARLSDMLTPTVTQRVVGEAEIAQIFQVTVKGRLSKPVAGCKVRNGMIARNSKIKVLRDKDVVFDGTLASLKNVKKDVTEIRKGNECGMGFEDWDEFQVGDQVQCYEEDIEKRTL
ncbi:MAG: hypothetical protein M1836_000621 [Candelina mexicana]|nr:MAG: hypothetical protein M1836_000621 [Candelina mexicana]